MYTIKRISKDDGDTLYDILIGKEIVYSSVDIGKVIYVICGYDEKANELEKRLKGFGFQVPRDVVEYEYD